MKTSNASSYQIVNTTSGETLRESSNIHPYLFSSPDIEVVYDYDKIKSLFSSSDIQNFQLPLHEKFLHLLPISSSDKLIHLAEGNTPLLPSRQIGKQLGISQLYFKNEGANPTGSFKDRGTVIEVAKALKYQAKAITVASTGNMAASIAAYSAAAGLPCIIFVPQGTPQTKLAQALFFGSHIIQVEGTYDNAAKTALQTANHFNFYLAGDYAFRAEGQKSQAYEIVFQLQGQVPDFVIVPVGNGTNIYAIWKGFQELHQLGLISSLPTMVGVQIAGFNPIYHAWKGAVDNSPPPTTIPTASAIAVKQPGDLTKVLKLIKQSHGELITVTNEEVIPSQIELAQTESLLVEPSSATVLAALKKFVSSRQLSPQSSIVCLLSGIGLKDVQSGLQTLSDHSRLCNSWTQIQTVIQQEISNL